MVSNVPPPTDVLTVVFFTWAVGTIVGAAASRLWSEVQAGHFKVVWIVGGVLAFAAGFGYRPSFLLAAACAGSYAAIYRDADRVFGLATAGVAIVLLSVGTDLSPHAFAAAALMGAVTNAMLLGHWHLNQPKLGTKPIARLVVALWAGVGVYIAAASMMTALAVDSGGVRLVAAITALAFTLFAAVLTAPVHHLVHTRSIMSATGILYLEILLCFVAVFTGSVASLTRG